ncbi:MAG: IS3 family transposase [Bacillota bacterium]|nr:IS3 family transposase [Bacillota bacterium]
MENELLWAKTGKPGPLPPRGRGGERDDLRDHWSPLWLGACLPGLGTGAVVVLRPAAALKKRASANEAGTGPLLTDEELLGHIRTDLAASPFSGEGHRKVWARLRVQRGVRVARKRVLRLMRAHNLLSWRRCRQGVGNPHQGEIVTRALSQPPRDIPSSPQRSQ